MYPEIGRNCPEIDRNRPNSSNIAANWVETLKFGRHRPEWASIKLADIAQRPTSQNSIRDRNASGQNRTKWPTSPKSVEFVANLGG